MNVCTFLGLQRVYYENKYNKEKHFLVYRLEYKHMCKIKKNYNLKFILSLQILFILYTRKSLPIELSSNFVENEMYLCFLHLANIIIFL